MKKGLTELVFILDRSGSMSGLESDTIGGYNSMLEKQKKASGQAVVTTVLFDDQYELLHDRIQLEAVSKVTEKAYYVRGMTALLDAMGKTIHKIANVQKHTAKDARADKVVFVIITDGMENASREYGYKQVQKLVERHRDQYGWEFIFLGANIDAIATASQFGIQEDRAVNYHADKAGTALNYQVISETVSKIRSDQVLEADWKASIERDYKSRKKQ